MKKINKGVILEFTEEEVKALDIALPLLREIADIVEESDGIIRDEINGTTIIDSGDVCCMEYLVQVLLHRNKVAIETDF